MKRVLILTGDGGEGWYAIDRFREAGHDAVWSRPPRGGACTW